MEEERLVVDLDDVVAPVFKSGRGVLLINSNQTDQQIALAIRTALKHAKGSAFQVSGTYIESGD